MAAEQTFDGFDRPALAEAEGGIDDTETMEAKPAQKTSEVFLHLTIATRRFLSFTSACPLAPTGSCPLRGEGAVCALWGREGNRRA